MKRIYLPLFYFLIINSNYPQILIGKIIDKTNLEPIEYVNIGILNKNVGTVSNVNGEFSLDLKDKFMNDTLLISCIGYESRIYLISNLHDSLTDIRKIFPLKRIIYEMSEVVVKPFGSETFNLGNFCDKNSAYGNAFYSTELGTEIGVIIKLPEGKNLALLKNFRFFVGKFTFDEFSMRLNIYNLSNGMPHLNILNESIIFKITRSGEHTIDLGKHNIILRGDFFISIEHYRVPDRSKGELIFCAVEIEDEGNGYYRLTSQGNWSPEIVANTGFSVQIKCEE